MKKYIALLLCALLCLPTLAACKKKEEKAEEEPKRETYTVGEDSVTAFDQVLTDETGGKLVANWSAPTEAAESDDATVKDGDAGDKNGDDAAKSDDAAKDDNTAKSDDTTKNDDAAAVDGDAANSDDATKGDDAAAKGDDAATSTDDGATADDTAGDDETATVPMTDYYDYQMLKSAKDCAKSYAELLMGGENPFELAVDAANPTAEEADYTADAGIVLLNRMSVNGEKLLLCVQVEWGATSCLITLYEKEGQTQSEMMKGAGSLSFTSAVKSIRQLKPSELGLPGDSMDAYSIYPGPGLITVEGQPCLTVNIYSKNAQQTNQYMGTYFVADNLSAIYRQLNDEAQTVEKIDLTVEINMPDETAAGDEETAADGENAEAAPDDEAAKDDSDQKESQDS